MRILQSLAFCYVGPDGFRYRRAFFQIITASKSIQTINTCTATPKPKRR